ncbi:P68 family surface lipoprotein [Mycoplasma sp. Sp33II]|uniref:P68 family surface lipoprotein n=1 Tax=unclassified Mycoplasma TaxID=2683645 RepID=UPI003AB08DAF
MNFKFKNILLGAAGLVGVTTVALSAGCNTDTDKPVDGTNTPQPAPQPGPVTPGAAEEIFGTTLADRIDNGQEGAMITPTKESFDQTDVKNVTIGVTFSKGGPQFKTLEAIATKYNSLIQQQADKFKGALPVKIKSLGSGYKAGSDSVSRDLNPKQPNKDAFENIIVNYPDVASNLATSNMLLSFNDQVADYNLDLTSFEESFLSANVQTQNIDRVSTWVLPGFKSTTVLAINSPVLSYILETMKSNGLKINPSFEAKVNKIIELGTPDREGVKQIWGAPVQNAATLVAAYAKSLPEGLDESVFNSYSSLMKFAIVAQSLFSVSSTANSGLYVFGVDDFAAVFNQALYSRIYSDEKVDGNVIKARTAMIESVSKSSTGQISIDYGIIKKPGSLANELAKDIYNETAEAVKAGALRIFPGGQYSSNDQVKHKFAFSIGSTAGYSHNYIEEGSLVQLVFENNSSLSYTMQSNLYANSGTGLFTITTKDAKDKSNPLLTILTGTKYRNNILAYTADDKAVGKYNYKFNSEADQAEFTKVVQSYSLNNTQPAADNKVVFGIIPYNVDAEKNDAALKTADDKLIANLKANNIFTGILSGKNGKYISFMLNNAYTVSKIDDPTGAKDKQGQPAKIDVAALDETAKALLTKVGFTYKALDSTQSLSEKELLSWHTPLKWNKAEKYNVVYLQGPSIIGIHANEKGDAATKLFVKWLIETKEKMQFDVEIDQNKVKTYNDTPLNVYQLSMGYITPFKGFYNNKDFRTQLNPYLQVTFDMFEKLSVKSESEADKFVSFEEPSSTFSSTFREGIQTGFNNLQSSVNNNKVNSGTPVQTYETFITNLQTAPTQK